jgi:hypothetical protein
MNRIPTQARIVRIASQARIITPLPSITPTMLRVPSLVQSPQNVHFPSKRQRILYQSKSTTGKALRITSQNTSQFQGVMKTDGLAGRMIRIRSQGKVLRNPSLEKLLNRKFSEATIKDGILTVPPPNPVPSFPMVCF